MKHVLAVGRIQKHDGHTAWEVVRVALDPEVVTFLNRPGHEPVVEVKIRSEIVQPA